MLDMMKYYNHVKQNIKVKELESTEKEIAEIVLSDI